jgi:hypothetical protein
MTGIMRIERMVRCSPKKSTGSARARRLLSLDEESEPLETLRENGTWLGHIHLADAKRLDPGTGVIRLPDVLRTPEDVRVSRDVQCRVRRARRAAGCDTVQRGLSAQGLAGRSGLRDRGSETCDASSRSIGAFGSAISAEWVPFWDD